MMNSLKTLLYVLCGLMVVCVGQIVFDLAAGRALNPLCAMAAAGDLCVLAAFLPQCRKKPEAKQE